MQAAYDIARFTAEDPLAGLPDADDIAPPETHRDLAVPPWAITSEEAAEMAACEAAASRRTAASPTAKARAFRPSKAISSAPTRAVFVVAMPARATACRWRPSHRCPARTARCSAMPGTAPCATRPTWPRPRPWAATPRARAEPPGQPQDPHHECPVLFESTLAAGLLGGFVQAVSGGSLYRKSSFLLDSLGKMVFPKHIDIWKTRSSWAARAARRLTKKACAWRRARWSGGPRAGLFPCPATRPASWA